MSSPDSAFRRLVDALTALEVPFFVGGSVAASIHGLPRATLDVDLIAALNPAHIAPLVTRLSEEFYADADMIREALRAGRSFNLIHYATGYKFDIFPLGPGPHPQAQLQRLVRRAISLAGDEPFEVPVESPEDTLLSKLVWYRAGGEVSERQWNDIRGIVETQGSRLDRDYLKKWARYLKVEDLLERL